MIGAFGKSFFRATPKQLLVQLLIDIVWFIIFRPTDPFSKWVFIAILPGIDLISALGSFWNYVKGNRQQ